MARLTTDEFIEKANAVHKGKYDYSKTEYKNTHTKVCIICPIHGEFMQTPHNHLVGQGCPECGKELAKVCHKHDYKLFLDTARNKFGNAFSFPNIENEYINNKTSVTVKCNTCGYEFMRRPNDLFSDKFKGCKRCNELKRLARLNRKKREILKKRSPKVTKEEFLKRFTDKFGDKISPFMNEYINTQKEIHFQCNRCGHIFKRRPHNSLHSGGCPKCKHVSNTKLTTEEFIERAKQIHGDKYDYSKVKYEGTEVAVDVICHEKDKFGEEHGVFKVTPHAHIGAMHSGCPKCSGKFRKDTEYFLKELKLVHGDKYLYDETVYHGALNLTKVICPTHGEFYNTPNQLLRGRGCPLCNESHLEREIRTFLDEKGIKYITQARFDWLRNETTNFKMSLDFFIADKNIAIECQGVQHFNADRFWKTHEDTQILVEKAKERDALKRKLCEEHGIRILYYSNLCIEYPYQVYEDKEELLKEISK